MANTHLGYPDLAIDKFSGADPDQDAQSFNQLTGRKIILALGDAPEDAGVLPLERKHFSLLDSEDQLPTGLRTTLRTPLHGIMSEQISSLDFQTVETSFGTESKWNTLSKKMERKFESFYIALK